MTDFQYKRAPITEAVIEIRSAAPADEIRQKKAFKNLKKNYSDFNSIPKHDIEVELRPGGDAVTHSQEVITKQLSSADMTQLLHVTQNSFLVSQLAPYGGWNKFKARIIRDWDIWRRHVGFQEVKRIGMRYINRIDMPVTGDILAYEEYLSVYPALPSIIDPCTFHAVNVRSNLDTIDSILNLKSAVVESPLPNHLAIVLDIDISRVFVTPQSDDDLYSYIDDARMKKNEIFEACITDKARELFNT